MYMMFHKVVAQSVKLTIVPSSIDTDFKTPQKFIDKVLAYAQILNYPQVTIKDTYEKGCICTLIDISRPESERYKNILVRQMKVFAGDIEDADYSFATFDFLVQQQQLTHEKAEEAQGIFI